MKGLALALALLAAGPAIGQGVSTSALPLEVGNRWEYVRGDLTVMRWEVVGDTTIAGERIARMQFDGGVICGIRTVASTDYPVLSFILVDPTAPSLGCNNRPEDFPNVFDRYGPPAITVFGDPVQQTVQIGDTTVTGGTWGSGVVSPETGPHYVDTSTVLDRIGLVSFRRTFGGTGNPQSETLRYRLAYARIGGVTYGQPLSSENPFADFLPLGVGDRWDYALVAGTPEAPDGVASLTVTSIVFDVPTRRIVWATLVRRSAGGAETVNACGTVIRGAFAGELYGSATFCGSPADDVFPSAFALQTESGPGQVEIGGQTVTADLASGVTTDTRYVSPNDVTTQRTIEAARGIGVLQWTFDVTYDSNPSVPVQHRRGQLVYSRVGGVETGQQAVAGEAEAPAAVIALTVGPNPARGAARLRFAASAWPSEALVTDALGRVVRRVAVPAGATEARLDMSGLAAGVYVTTVGTASARLVVAR